MIGPDLEHYYRLKGKLVDTIEAMPEDSPLRSAANDHLLKIDARIQKSMDNLVREGMDDLYYVREAVNSVM